MQIVFNMPHVFYTPSSAKEAQRLHVDNACALHDLLECLIALNISFLKFRPRTSTLYRSGVRYGRTVWWEPIPALYQRKYGDCKSLSAALIAEYRLHGIEAKPVFRWIYDNHGSNNFHILVQTNSGFEDPSKVLGMNQDENAYFSKTDGSVTSWDPSQGFHHLT